jgi:acetoin utilization protein AcuC
MQLAPRTATRAELELFQDPAYVDFVVARSATGEGLLDAGDTPAFKGVFEAACDVVGASLVACDAVMTGRVKRGFVPIAGLHHAGRAHAAGFCVFNDIGVVIERLKRDHGLSRIAYVDIDAHHGDGVFYHSRTTRQSLCRHARRRALPVSGHGRRVRVRHGRGDRAAEPALAAGRRRCGIFRRWPAIESHLERHAPEFISSSAAPTASAGTRSPT